MKKNVIAHRGLFDNQKIVENTLPAFQECIDQSIPFELDVQLTLDHKIVVFHDDDLVRLTGKEIVIQNTNYDELRSISLLNQDVYIPLLSEVLKRNQDKVFIDIEIKPTKKIVETISVLMNELENYHNYSLKSFNPRIIRYIKKHYPNVTCGLLIHSHYDHMLWNILCHSSFIRKYSKADFLSLHKKLFEKEKYKKLFLKYPIQVWTIKDSSEVVDDQITYICNIKK